MNLADPSGAQARVDLVDNARGRDQVSPEQARASAELMIDVETRVIDLIPTPQARLMSGAIRVARTPIPSARALTSPSGGSSSTSASGPSTTRPDFITNSQGVTMSTSRDHNLVDTQTPTDRGGDWMQLHNTHTDRGISPHTHEPGATSTGAGGQSRPRETRQTEGSDMTRADTRIRNGELRERRSRRDQGGTP